MNKFVCYKKCSTCLKAKKFLKDLNKEFEYIEVSEVKREDLMDWLKLADINDFFNYKGKSFKLIKDKFENLTKEDKIELLLNDGMLFKRPLLVSDKKILFGFNEEGYRDF